MEEEKVEMAMEEGNQGSFHVRDEPTYWSVSMKWLRLK